MCVAGAVGAVPLLRGRVHDLRPLAGVAQVSQVTRPHPVRHDQKALLRAQGQQISGVRVSLHAVTALLSKYENGSHYLPVSLNLAGGQFGGSRRRTAR